MEEILSKFLKKIITFALLTSLVFGVLGQFFFVPQKAKAAPVVNPPSPTDPTIYFRFGATDNRDQILVDFNQPPNTTPPSYSFQRSEDNVSLDRVDVQSTLKNLGIKYLWSYSMIGAKNIYLLVGSKNTDPINNAGSDSYTYELGLYYQQSGVFDKTNSYQHFTGASLSLATFDWPPDKGAHLNHTQFMTLAWNQAGKLRINYAGTITDLCNNLNPAWTRLVQNFIILFGQDPADNNKYWKSEDLGTGTELKVTGTMVYTGFRVGGPLGAMLAAGASPGLLSKWSGGTKGYELTDVGNEIGIQIRKDAQQIQSITDTIINQNGPNAWPKGCTPPQKLNESWQPSGVTFTPQELRDYMPTLIAFFEKLKATYSQPGSGDRCGNWITRGFNMGQMFLGLLCEGALLTHSAAAWAMGKAAEYLNAYVGVKSQFVAPAKDESASLYNTSSSSSPTDTPTAGTPSGTTGGTTNESNIKLSLYANIVFSNANDYNWVKNNKDKINITIGAPDKTAYEESGSFKGSITYNSFEDATKTIRCRITSTQSAPTSLTRIEIKGSAGANKKAYFLFTVAQTNLGNTDTTRLIVNNLIK